MKKSPQKDSAELIPDTLALEREIDRGFEKLIEEVEATK